MRYDKDGYERTFWRTTLQGYQPYMGPPEDVVCAPPLRRAWWKIHDLFRYGKWYDFSTMAQGDELKIAYKRVTKRATRRRLKNWGTYTCKRIVGPVHKTEHGPMGTALDDLEPGETGRIELD